MGNMYDDAFYERERRGWEKGWFFPSWAEVLSLFVLVIVLLHS